MPEVLEAGRELDVRIAREVLAKKPCHFSESARFSAWATAWQCRCATTHGCYPENKSAIEDAHSPLPKYSLILQAAWDVLVDPQSKFVALRSLSSHSGSYADFKLCCNYPGRDTYWLEYTTAGGFRRGPDAKTPALAICAAALEALNRPQ